MKKAAIILAAVLLSLFLLGSGSVASTGEVKVIVDTKRVTFDVPPVIENGRTLVPVRAIFEALGAAVTYNEKTKVVTAQKDETKILITIGSDKATVDGVTKTLDVPAKILNGRTLVPLRFISESLGAKVDWEGVNRVITITSKPVAVFVNIKDFQFNPAVLTITKGQTVSWTNSDTAVHTVTGGPLDSGDLAKGETYSFTFDETGTFHYVCLHHSGMKGTVVVK